MRVLYQNKRIRVNYWDSDSQWRINFMSGCTFIHLGHFSISFFSKTFNREWN